MKFKIICGLMVVVGSVCGMDQNVNWHQELEKGPEEFKISEKQSQKFEQELGDFVEKGQEEQEKQLEEWKKIDLRKIVFIAAKAKEMGLEFKNGIPLVDALCEWIADRLNYHRYQELAKNTYFKAVESNIGNVIALILIKKNSENSLTIPAKSIQKACKEESFLSHLFMVLSKKESNKTIAGMSRDDLFKIMGKIVFSEHDKDEDEKNDKEEVISDNLEENMADKKNIVDEKLGAQENNNGQHHQYINIEEVEESGDDDDDDDQFNQMDQLRDQSEEEENEENINLEQENKPQVPIELIKVKKQTYWDRFTGWLNDKKKWIFATLGIGTASVVTYYLWKTKQSKK